MRVDDLADCCLNIIANHGRDSLGELVNVGTGIDMRIADLAKLIKGIVGSQGEIRYDSTKPDGTPRKLLNVDKLARTGWKAGITLEEGVRRIFQWYLQPHEVRPSA